jgi:hypothetical protein
MKVKRGMGLLRHPRYDRTATSMCRSSPIGLRDAVLSQIIHDQIYDILRTEVVGPHHVSRLDPGRI